MTTALLSFMIAALFAFWVWDLKHKMESPKRHAGPVGPLSMHSIPATAPVAHPVAPKTSTAAVQPHRMAQKTREGNIPVWTIEA